MRAVVVSWDSLAVSSYDGERLVDAVRRQVVRDFCPAWGLLPVEVQFDIHVAPGGPEHAVVRVVDHADLGSAFLGAHAAGPFGRGEGVVDVFAILFGQVHDVDPIRWAASRGPLNLSAAPMPGSVSLGPRSISAVLSHEVLEAIVDPACALWADGPPSDKVGGAEYALEVCDPVEDDVYDVAGVDVSDFVLPAWFRPHAPADRLDHLGLLREPFELRPGGYAIRRPTGPGGLSTLGPDGSLTLHPPGPSAVGEHAAWRGMARARRRGAGRRTA